MGIPLVDLHAGRMLWERAFLALTSLSKQRILMQIASSFNRDAKAEDQNHLLFTELQLTRLKRNLFASAPWLKGRVLAYFVLSLVFFALIIPLILGPAIDVFDERDESLFHYPTILAFREQFPNLNFANYGSATTPLYHVVLVMPALVFGSNLIPLRFISSLLSLACVLVVYEYFFRRGGTLRGLYFAVLFFVSPYFIGSAIRLSTDNLALLFALLSILIMDVRRPETKTSLATNLLILLAILTRQIYAWLIGAYLLFNFQLRKHNPAFKHLIASYWPAMIPAVGLFYFISLWQGLTPPDFAIHQAYWLNWDVPIYVVSLLGVYGLFFAVWQFELYSQNQRQILPIVLAFTVSLCCLFLSPISNAYDRVNRGGALWLMISILPTPLYYAVIYGLLFPIGTLCAYTLIWHLIRRQDYLMAICFVLWIIANMTNTRVYQKYYDPLLLFFIGYALVTVKSERRFSWIGPLILLAGFTVLALFRFF